MPAEPLNRIPEIAGHWLLGSAREIARSPHGFVAEAGARPGGLTRFRVLHRSFVATSDAGIAHQILVQRGDRYHRAYHNRNLGLLIGNGLLSTEGDGWLKRRRQVQPSLKLEAIERLTPVFCETAHALFARWDEWAASAEAIDALAAMQEFSISAICRVLLSSGASAADAARFGALAREGGLLIRQRNTGIAPLPMALPSPANRRLRKIRQAFDDFLAPHLNRNSGAPAADLLAALQGARDPETSDRLSPQELLDETKTLLVAGFETTATSLAWTLYLLASHPDAAGQWRAEVDRELAGRPPDAESVRKLHYTSQVVHEAMRLYPAVYTMSRECVAADELAGYPIAKGTILLISIYGIHRGPEWGADAVRFRPERFEPGTWPKRAYLPFGAGRHLCAGNFFALQEMMVLLAMLAQRYTLSLATNGEVEPQGRITLMPGRSILLRLNKR